MELTKKDAQSDYEAMMKDSAEKQAEDSKSMGVDKELSLHSDCDWLLKCYGARKDAQSDKEVAFAETEEELVASKESLKGKNIDIMGVDCRGSGVAVFTGFQCCVWYRFSIGFLQFYGIRSNF